MAKRRSKAAVAVEPVAEDAEVIPITEAVETFQESPVETAPAPGSGALGWTPELTSRLKWVITHAKAFEEVAMEIDRESAHLVYGIIALGHGDFELAALNLWHVGLVDTPPPAVEESEE